VAATGSLVASTGPVTWVLPRGPGLPTVADPLGSMLQIIVTIVHVLQGLALIGLVLLHSGKGGGLSDMFGGGMGAAAGGSTVMEKNLDRITVVVAVGFVFTTVGLALLMD
jgi:preprotein translocase subunit SecG